METSIQVLNLNIQTGCYLNSYFKIITILLVKAEKRLCDVQTERFMNFFTIMLPNGKILLSLFALCSEYSLL